MYPLLKVGRIVRFEFPFLFNHVGFRINRRRSEKKRSWLKVLENHQKTKYELYLIFIFLRKKKFYMFWKKNQNLYFNNISICFNLFHSFHCLFSTIFDICSCIFFLKFLFWLSKKYQQKKIENLKNKNENSKLSFRFSLTNRIISNFSNMCFLFYCYVA